jgi:hypothetical protein
VWKTIVEIADRHDAAIIVMGSRGLTGLRPMLQGSVSSAIVHHADRPTLIIRHSTQQTGRSPHLSMRVLKYVGSLGGPADCGRSSIEAKPPTIASHALAQRRSRRSARHAARPGARCDQR